MMNTNWSSPKRNMFSAINLLRTALASGYNARLIKARNEDCEFPLKEKHEDQDFRNFEFSSGHLSTRDEILNDTNMSEFEKYLSLNYKTCYGTEEAVKRYYETGELSEDNFKGVGRSHFVKVSDMVEFYKTLKGIHAREYAEMYEKQYFGEEQNNRYFWDFYTYKHGSQWAVKKFKRKLWVVEILDTKQLKAKTPVLVKLLNIILYPLKYIPRKSVLRMPKYTKYDFRIGDVIHGFSVEFQIPKKFSF